MNPKTRRDRILDCLRERGRVTVEELAASLSVSRETIRRDLTLLSNRGQLRKFHGGATWPYNDGEDPFQERMSENVAAKRAIARRAAALFAPGDALFVDTGSTTVYFAEELIRVAELRVITNSSMIAAIMSGSANGTRVYLLGGEFNGENQETFGAMATAMIRHFRARHAVLTVAALNAEAGIMDHDTEEAQVARAIVDQAQTLTVLADATKFDRTALFEVAPWSAVSRLVVDRPPGDALARRLKSAGVEVLVA